MLKNKKYQLIIVTLLILFGLFPNVTLANTAYKTFTEDGYGRYVETQSAYSVKDTIVKFDDELFSQASDLKIGPNGYLYVSDTGKQRILVGDKKVI